MSGERDQESQESQESQEDQERDADTSGRARTRPAQQQSASAWTRLSTANLYPTIPVSHR